MSKECVVFAQLATFIEWKNLGHDKYLVSSIFSSVLKLLFNKPFRHQTMILILDGIISHPWGSGRYLVDQTGFPKYGKETSIYSGTSHTASNLTGYCEDNNL